MSDQPATKQSKTPSGQSGPVEGSSSGAGSVTTDLGKREPIPGPSLKNRIKKLTSELAAEAVRDAEAASAEPLDGEKAVKGTEPKSKPEKPTASSEESAKPDESSGSSSSARSSATTGKPEKSSDAKEELDAEPLAEDDVKQIDDTTGHGVPSKSKPASTSTGDQLWQIVFQMLENDTRSITVRVDRVTVVGRLDSEDPAAEADLDLGPYGGAELGVSRQHAILMPNIEGLWLVDLDSTNGTWINGLYLQPGMKYRLRNGDVIDFGSLRVLVRVIGAISYIPSQEENAGSATLVSRRKPPRSGI